MSYLPNDPGFLDYATLPLKALAAPWGGVQTLAATRDPSRAWEALLDPDKAVRGRQLLEALGIADPHSGAWADAIGIGIDVADPIAMGAFSGIGKGIQALRGIPTAARAAEGASSGGRALAHAINFGLPMTGAALIGQNEREGWDNPYIQALGAGMEVAPLALGGYHLARGLLRPSGQVPEVTQGVTPARLREMRAEELSARAPGPPDIPPTDFPSSAGRYGSAAFAPTRETTGGPVDLLRTILGGLVPGVAPKYAAPGGFKGGGTPPPMPPELASLSASELTNLANRMNFSNSRGILAAIQRNPAFMEDVREALGAQSRIGKQAAPQPAATPPAIPGSSLPAEVAQIRGNIDFVKDPGLIEQRRFIAEMNADEAIRQQIAEQQAELAKTAQLSEKPPVDIRQPLGTGKTLQQFYANLPPKAQITSPKWLEKFYNEMRDPNVTNWYERYRAPSVPPGELHPPLASQAPPRREILTGKPGPAPLYAPDYATMPTADRPTTTTAPLGPGLASKYVPIQAPTGSAVDPIQALQDEALRNSMTVNMLAGKQGFAKPATAIPQESKPWSAAMELRDKLIERRSTLKQKRAIDNIDRQIKAQEAAIARSQREWAEQQELLGKRGDIEPERIEPKYVRRAERGDDAGVLAEAARVSPYPTLVKQLDEVNTALINRAKELGIRVRKGSLVTRAKVKSFVKRTKDPELSLLLERVRGLEKQVKNAPEFYPNMGHHGVEMGGTIEPKETRAEAMLIHDALTGKRRAPIPGREAHEYPEDLDEFVLASQDLNEREFVDPRELVEISDSPEVADEILARHIVAGPNQQVLYSILPNTEQLPHIPNITAATTAVTPAMHNLAISQEAQKQATGRPYWKRRELILDPGNMPAEIDRYPVEMRRARQEALESVPRLEQEATGPEENLVRLLAHRLAEGVNELPAKTAELPGYRQMTVADVPGGMEDLQQWQQARGWEAAQQAAQEVAAQSRRQQPTPYLSRQQMAQMENERIRSLLAQSEPSGGPPLGQHMGFRPQSLSPETLDRLIKALGITNPAVLAMLLGGGGAALAQSLTSPQYQQTL